MYIDAADSLFDDDPSHGFHRHTSTTTTSSSRHKSDSHAPALLQRHRSPSLELLQRAVISVDAKRHVQRRSAPRSSGLYTTKLPCPVVVVEVE